MSSRPSPQHDQWQPCQPGELSSVADQLIRDESGRQRQQTLQRAIVGLATVLVVAVGVSLWVTDEEQPPLAPFGGITCAECFEAFPEYHTHLTQGVEMRKDFAVSMNAHLEECEMCRHKFEQRFPGVLSVGLQRAGRLLASGTPPAMLLALATTCGV